MMYKCTGCKETKWDSEFYKSSYIKRGIQYYCKSCQNKMSEKRRQLRIQNGPNIIRDSKVCPKCNNKKPISQFHIYRSSSDGHLSYCKPCWITITKKAQAKRKEI